MPGRHLISNGGPLSRTFHNNFLYLWGKKNYHLRMEISFKTNQLEKDLNSAKRLRKKYGDVRARYIMRRMKVLAASPTLAEVPHQPPERCHQLTGARDEQCGVTVKDQWRIVFRINHEPIPRKEDNGMDLNKITKVAITWTGDYHD